MDRVDVPGHARVAAAYVAVELPGGRGAVALGRCAAARFARGLAVTAATEIRAGRAPHALAAGIRLRHQIDLRAAAGAAEVLRANGQRHGLGDVEWPQLLDPVAHVDHPQQRQRERAVGHDLHRHRERVDVQVGGWRAIREPEPAHAVVGREVTGIEAHLGQRKLEVRELVAASPGQGSEQRLRVQLRHARRAVEPLDAHAPRMLWPHTRTTWPFTPPEPGLAIQAIASATSTGSPP